jgi:hypothetical protein
MTRKRITPPWVRTRRRRRVQAALVIFTALVAIAALALLAYDRNAAIQDAVRVVVTAHPSSMGSAAAVDSSNRSGDFPDSSLTPGAVVTNDVAVICRQGYATSVRPEGALWRHLKEEAYGRYGVPHGHRSKASGYGVRRPAYQVDHLIPLELGGSPTDIRNIWPQPIEAAVKKDRVENELHDLVCDGRMSLTQAQIAIARDWETAVPARTTR